MLRITRIDDDHRLTRLRLEGRLTRSELAAFEEACAGPRRDGRELVLDLGGLGFADREGSAALRRLRKHDATLTNATAFLEELLEEEGK